MTQELTTILNTKLDSKALSNIDKLKQGLQQVTAAAQKVSLAVAAVGTSLFAMAKLAGDNAVQLQKLSETSGMSTEALQEIVYACESVGVSFQSVSGDLSKLQGELSNPIPGKVNEGLYLLGISATDSSGKMKDSMQVLTDVSAKISKMSTQKAMDYGKKIGISEDTVRLLMKGKDGIEALRKESVKMGAVVPQKAVNGLAEFSKSMNQLKMISRSMANTFLGLLAPALNKIVQGYKNWSSSNGNIMKSGMEFVVKQISKAFDMIGTVLQKVWQGTSKVGAMFTPLINIFKKGNVVAAALTVALGSLVGFGFMKVISILRMVNPWLIAIAVLVEELYVWFTKGFESTGFYKLWTVFEKKFPSVAAKFKDVFGVIKKVVLDLVDILRQVWDVTQPIRDAFLELGKAVLSALKPVAEFLLDTWMKMFETIGNIIGWIKDNISGLTEPFKKIGSMIGKVAGWISGKSGKTDVEVTKESIQNITTVPSNNTTMNTTNNTMNNNQKVTGTTNVYIQGMNAGNSGQIMQSIKETYGNSTNIISPGMSNPIIQ